MTKREKALTAAQEQGRKDCRNNWSMPSYDGDVGLQEAWKQGYTLEQKELEFWHQRGSY